MLTFLCMIPVGPLLQLQEVLFPDVDTQVARAFLMVVV